MRKVGATSSGSVIIEMSNAQFEALQLVASDKPRNQEAATPPETSEKPEVKVMAVKRKLDHVRNCILKLKPNTLDELMRSVRTIQPFTGGFAEKEIEHLLKILVREGLFTINAEGHVRYGEQEPAATKYVPIDSFKGDSVRKKEPLMSD